MDLRDIAELVNLVSSRDISELEVDHEGFRVRIVKASPGAIVRAAAPPPSAPAAVSVERITYAAPQAASADLAPPPAEEADVHLMRAPIVGTFYRAPSPAAEPYIKVADRAKKGQVICIVEAMKLMNEIESEVSGVVVEILAEDGQPVEYGQPLFKIRPDK